MPSPTVTPVPTATPTPTASPTPTATPIPLPSIEEQRAALAAFYAATNGDNWTNNNGWLSDLPLDQWHGVTTDEHGNVTVLWLPQNNLSGPIPAAIAQLASLYVLDLWGNQLTGNIPPELGQLTALTHLVLNTNSLSGTIPAEVGNLKRLGTLDLSYNELTGNIPKTLGNLTALTGLYLGENQLTGKIPEELSNLTKLERVQIDDSFEGCIPDSWRRVGPNDLGTLNLDYCGSKSDPDDRAVLVKLYNSTDGDNWRNNENWLSDRPIGAWNGVETDAQGKVTHLILWLNNLTGKIPIEVAKLAALRVLDLSRNTISGPIPPAIGQMTNLEKLDLVGNKISGAIPSELADLANLVDLSLASNELTGEFPEWVGGLHSLEKLNLSDNRLSGDVTRYAEDLDALKNLKTVSIAGNNLSGCLPETLRDVEETDFIFSTLNYCDEPPKQPPVTPKFIKWEVGDDVRPIEERVAKLGVQWLFDFAESIGWPIVGDDIVVHFKTRDDMLQAIAMVDDGKRYVGGVERLRQWVPDGLALDDSNFAQATNEGDPITTRGLYRTLYVLIHENIHTAFQNDIDGFHSRRPPTDLARGWAPAWFIEGMAEYFAHRIVSLHGDGLSMCRSNCVVSHDRRQPTEIPLSYAEVGGTCEYRCGALAIELLASIVGQRHIVDLLTMRRPGQTWQQTFEEVFGMSVPDFYALYDQHRDAGFPELNPPIVPETGR